MDKKKTKKMQTSQRTSNSKGITLVALVITIIIIIILATVTINFAFGDNGLISQAELARDLTVNSTEYESDAKSNLVAFMNEAFGEIVSEEPDFPTPPGGTLTDDGVPIPSGFYYVGGTKNDGVVISDSPADENQGTEHEKVAGMQGNQFVWVPVEDISEMFVEEIVKLNGVETTTNVYSRLRIRDVDKEKYTSVKPGNTSSVREPDVLSMYDIKSTYYQELGYGSTKEMADAFVQEYTDMYESIKKYGGFYIGRYELTGTVETPTVKVGIVLASQNWYKMRKLCTEIIKNNANVASTMIYGVEWDETMNWLKNTIFSSSPEKVDEDSSSWGNYDNSSGAAAIEGAGEKQETGYSEAWSVNHIYDLAGNCYENTQEAVNTSSRFLRGRLSCEFKFG